MACPSSGQIKIQDIVDEFGGSAPHSLSEYYRDGGEVPGNNTNVPTSGAISLSNFYDAVNEIQITISSGTTNYSCSTQFGGNWTSTVPKRLIINSGVVIGGTGSSPALTIEGSMAGTLIVENAGTIRGFGGAANGGEGGDAVLVSTNSPSNITINNQGQGSIQAGGGGGGVGGEGGEGGNGGQGGEGGNGGGGGNGTYTQNHGYVSRTLEQLTAGNHGPHAQVCPNVGLGTCTGTLGYQNSNTQMEDNPAWCTNCASTASSSGGNGGAGGTTRSGGSGGGGGANGGNGGVGAGYQVSAGSGAAGTEGAGGTSGQGSTGGSGGTSGGTSAGNGGSGGSSGAGGNGGAAGDGGEGGDGGGYGQAGQDGATGATGASGQNGTNGQSGQSGQNGNASNGGGGQGGSNGTSGQGGQSGTGGAEGGLAGYYIANPSYATLNNQGTVQGRN